MFILGIFGGQGPNPSAALLNGDKLIAIGEEERFCRIKNAPSMLPINSIMYCLKRAQINLDQVHSINFAWDCPHYVQYQPQFLDKIHSQYDFDDQDYNRLHEKKLLTNLHPKMIFDNLKFSLAKFNQKLDPNKFFFHNHHKCHAASAFYASNFNKALIFTIDGSGEENCTGEWIAENGDIKLYKFHTLPNTLGGYYGTFTEFLGFKSDSEEGKLMGLAPYGKYSEYFQKKLSNILYFNDEENSYNINPKYRYFEKRTYNSKFTDLVVDLFGKPRLSGEKISQYHKDLAFNVQFLLEKIVSKLIKDRIKKFNIKNVCLAGGVAMNCKMNGVISEINELENLYVQPASSDNGTALGAALIASKKLNYKPSKIMNHAYFGNEYNDEEILEAILESKLKYKKDENFFKKISNYLYQGKIIALFQGRSEIGARSLGNRSILANPLMPDIKNKLNLEVKHREAWRPFCPSFTSESFEFYFGHNKPADFMIIAYYIKKKFISLFPSAVHIDGSVRPQSVKKETNPLFHSLLKEFGKISGHPVLINTSFNIQGEPIVETPRDALRCFGGTGIDVLVIGNYILEK